MSTKAVEVSIQAVSPALILSTLIKKGSVGAETAAAAAGALDASSAQAACVDMVSSARSTHRDSIFINANLPL
jgi:hypothetical protein